MKAGRLPRWDASLGHSVISRVGCTTRAWLSLSGSLAKTAAWRWVDRGVQNRTNQVAKEKETELGRSEFCPAGVGQIVGVGQGVQATQRLIFSPMTMAGMSGAVAIVFQR
jgi:hypothetical protein